MDAIEHITERPQYHVIRALPPWSELNRVTEVKFTSAKLQLYLTYLDIKNVSKENLSICSYLYSERCKNGGLGGGEILLKSFALKLG